MAKPKTSKPRTDPHRPGALVPADYFLVLTYGKPGLRINCIDDKAEYAPLHGPSKAVHHYDMRWREYRLVRGTRLVLRHRPCSRRRPHGR